MTIEPTAIIASESANRYQPSDAESKAAAERPAFTQGTSTEVGKIEHIPGSTGHVIQQIEKQSSLPNYGNLYAGLGRIVDALA